MRAPSWKRLKLKELNYKTRSKVVSVARATSSKRLSKLRIVLAPLIRISKLRRNALVNETN